jgi:hypothetical protein
MISRESSDCGRGRSAPVKPRSLDPNPNPVQFLMRLANAVCLIAVLLGALPAYAQQRHPEPLVADPSVACMVATGAIRVLSGKIASALVDSTARPWTVEVADSTSPVWRQLADGERQAAVRLLA